MKDIILKLLGTKIVIGLIARGITYLVQHKTAGVGKELSLILIKAIAQSSHNDFVLSTKVVNGNQRIRLSGEIEGV